MDFNIYFGQTKSFPDSATLFVSEGPQFILAN